MAGESTALAMSLGRLSPGDQPRVQLLCEAAERELAQRLHGGFTPADCGENFYLAAAWLALSGLAAAEEMGGGIQHFSAGDVSITEGGGKAIDRAAELRRQGERLLAPYLKDAGFQFRGVCG